MIESSIAPTQPYALLVLEANSPQSADALSRLMRRHLAYCPDSSVASIRESQRIILICPNTRHAAALSLAQRLLEQSGITGFRIAVAQLRAGPQELALKVSECERVLRESQNRAAAIVSMCDKLKAA